jgi:hypothetical protein
VLVSAVFVLSLMVAPGTSPQGGDDEVEGSEVEDTGAQRLISALDVVAVLVLAVTGFQLVAGVVAGFGVGPLPGPPVGSMFRRPPVGPV